MNIRVCAREREEDDDGKRNADEIMPRANVFNHRRPSVYARTYT